MSQDCTGTALVFSGRPDPEWPVDRDQAARLRALWLTMTAAASVPPSAPALGYRGCALRCATGEEWLAYGGSVSLTSASGSDRRGDPERQFERLLLATAPRGMLPSVL